MTKRQSASYGSFEQIAGRLDEIIGIVKDKNTSLERSLDLFDEAIDLGSRAVDMVDMTNLTAEEDARLQVEGSRQEGSFTLAEAVGGKRAAGTSDALDGEASQGS